MIDNIEQQLRAIEIHINFDEKAQCKHEMEFNHMSGEAILGRLENLRKRKRKMLGNAVGPEGFVRRG